MAQTQHPTDSQAWTKAAASRNFSVVDGNVEIEKDGAIAIVPAPEGFADLKPSVQPMVFHAVAEYVRNRIGQSLNGVSLQDAVIDAVAGNSLPNAKSNDAREAIFRQFVADKIEEKMPLGENATAAEKAERAALVTASCAMKSNRDAYFDQCIADALAAGKVAAAARERKRTAKKAGVAL